MLEYMGNGEIINLSQVNQFANKEVKKGQKRKTERKNPPNHNYKGTGKAQPFEWRNRKKKRVEKKKDREDGKFPVKSAQKLYISRNLEVKKSRIILWFRNDIRLHDNYMINWAL